MRVVVLGLLPGCVWLTDGEVDGLLDADGDRAVSAALGGPDCDDADPAVQERVQFADGDGDGLGAERSLAAGCDAPDPGHVDDGSDCDDADPTVGAPGTQHLDDDGDGYGDPATAELATSCQLGPGRVVDGTDCDDADPDLNPDTTWFPDGDGDGLGDAAAGVVGCAAPGDAWVREGTDCDDGDAGVLASTFEDRDGDGFGSARIGCGGVAEGGDCDDDPATGATLVPGTPYVLDEDGDGFDDPTVEEVVSCAPPAPGWIPASASVGDDCDDADAGQNPETLWYRDVDEDGFGVDAVVDHFCGALDGWAAVPGDCQDGDPLVNPASTWFSDFDGDGFGVAPHPDGPICDPDPGIGVTAWVLVDGDCDDANSAVTDVAYEDFDGDGFGVLPGTDGMCLGGVLGAGQAGVPGDCDDAIAAHNPGATWYRDRDADGFGDVEVSRCSPPTVGTGPYVTAGGDCDDLDATTYPGAVDVPRDGVDSDCDGTDLHLLGASEPSLPGCAPPLTFVPVGSDGALADALAMLDECQVLELAPGVYSPVTAPAVSFARPWMVWAPDGALFLGEDAGPVGLTLLSSTAPVYLEGLTFRGFIDAAISVSGAVDLTVSGVAVEDGAGIVQTGTDRSALNLYGVQFTRTTSAVVGAPRFEATTFTSLGAKLDDSLAIAPAVDVRATGSASMERTGASGAGVLDSLVRLDAPQVLVDGFALVDSVTLRVLDLGASETVTVRRVDLNHNGFAGTDRGAVLELAAPTVVAEDLRVVDNLALEPTNLLLACGQGDCFDVPQSTSASIRRAVFARNEFADSSVTVTVVGEGVLEQVVAHQSAGDWLHARPGTDGVSDVLVDHGTFAGFAAGKSGRIRAFTGAVELRGCVVDGDGEAALAGGITVAQSLPPTRDTGLVTVSGGSVVAEDLAETCACLEPCSPACVVDGSVQVVPRVGLVRSHAGLPAADADYRLVTTCEGACTDSPAYDPNGPDVGAYAPDAVHLFADLGEPRYDDGDGDGLPDDWELRYAPDLLTLGSGDPDGDSWSDLEEFAYGTSPVDPNVDGDCLDDPDDAAPYSVDLSCPLVP